MYIPRRTPPVAPVHPARIVQHGIERVDPYAWLRDPNWQGVLEHPEQLDPAIRAYVEAENTYTEEALAPNADLEAALIAQMRGRIVDRVEHPPFPDGPFLYGVRYEPGGEYPVYVRSRQDGTGVEEVLLDGNKEAGAHAHFSLGRVSHSPDHRYLSYTIDTTGSELYRLYIKEIATGVVVDMAVDRVGDVEWALDSKQVFYTKVDAQFRPHDVFLHTLGQPETSDRHIFGAEVEGDHVQLSRAESQSYILISEQDDDSSMVFVVPAQGECTNVTLVLPRAPGVRQEVHHHRDGYFLVLTNKDGATDFQVLRIEEGELGRSSGVTYIAHRPGIFIRELLVFTEHLVRLEVEDALQRVVVRDRHGAEHVIGFDSPICAYDLVFGFTPDTTKLRVMYSTPSTPPQVYDYDMATRERTLLRADQLPNGHDPKQYEVTRSVVEVAPGVTVPVTMLARADRDRSRPAPCLLYGYGSYGISMDCGWWSTPLALVDRGFLFVIAHIRGGSDCGYGWYLDGKLDRKMHTFTDFIAVAEALIDRGFTDPTRLCIQGGSAGGLLIGAVLNMRPELFAAAVAEVPFVDVVNTISDATLPLTPMEWNEWGNPITDPKVYALLASYAPYEQVAPRAYPHLLVTAGLTDPRVTYWEPAKWVAKLRVANTSDALILLRTEMGHGHQGTTGRYRGLADRARIFAFLIQATQKQ